MYRYRAYVLLFLMGVVWMGSTNVASSQAKDQDRDGDGVVDRLDKCPTVPGSKSRYGCPAPGKLASQNQSKVTTIFLVRHAEKVDSSRESALTSVGKVRAQALQRVLRTTPIHTIYSTPLRRTRQTVAPSAKARNMKITEVSQTKVLCRKLMSQHAGQTVLVSGHSNTIPEILQILGVKQKIVIGHNDYDDLFVVRWFRHRSPVLLHLHYGPPSPKP